MQGDTEDVPPSATTPTTAPTPTPTPTAPTDEDEGPGEPEAASPSADSATGAAVSGPAAGRATGAEWSLDDGLEGFQDTPWNNQGAEDPVAASSPNVPGRQAVRFTVPGGGKRSEAQPEGSEYKAGERKFFGYSAYLDDNFATNADSWQVIWQLHDGGTNGSPPVALEIGDGKLWLATAGNDQDKDLGAVAPGQNLAVQIEVEFEQGGGTVSVWRDRRQVVSNYTPPKGTMVDGSDYLKVGLYRDPSETKTSTLYLNDLKIGDSRASVSELAGETSSAAAPTADTPAPAAPATGAGVAAGLPFLLLLLCSRPSPGPGRHRRVMPARRRPGRRVRRRLWSGLERVRAWWR